VTAPFQVISGGASTRPPEPASRFFMRTDTGNAERLVARHGANIHYVPAWDRWIVWNDTRWVEDRKALRVSALAKETARSMFAEARNMTGDAREELVKHATKSEAAGRLAAMVDRARSEPGVAIGTELLNADPWLLNVQNGTIDLRTGQLRNHDRDDLITKVVPIRYDPSHTLCPRWEAFLQQVMAGKQELITFLQKAVGYSLTGLTTEQCLFFLYGSGSNGKSTFLELLRELLGDYSTQADFTTFIEKKGDGPRNDVARLYGARAVTSSEVGEGRRVNESLMKTLTGGDVIAARYLYSETFEFAPTFKLWLAANHRPVIRGTDYAIWRRFRIVPFTVQIPVEEQDKGLKDALRAELSGILAWAVAGCLLWQKDGLGQPVDVSRATDQYRRESDTLGAFLEDCCEVGEEFVEPASELYQVYAKWADEGGEYKMSQTRFGREMEERGFAAEKRGRGTERVRWRIGLRVVSGKTVPTVPGRFGAPVTRPSDRVTHDRNLFGEKELDD
jgi:putative DNA primase/helicase